MKTIAALAVSLLLLPTPAATADDARADAVARQLRDAMGGTEGWNRARFLRFDFIVWKDGKNAASFSHWWDRFDGRYRVEGVGKDGKKWKAVFNVNTREGDYFADGVRTDGEARKKGLEEAYDRFINDTYWLLAPWKTMDPGVHRDYVGIVKDADGHDCDEIKLSFDNVGLTPRDIYWLDVDRSTHGMTQWKYVLDGGSGPPTVSRWTDWKRFGAIELAQRHPFLGKPIEIRFENLAVSEKTDAAVFSPAP
jgi:hypothetical protein